MYFFTRLETRVGFIVLFTFRLEILIYFMRLRPREGNGLQDFIVTGAVGVGSVKSLRSWRQTALAFFD